MSEAVGRLTYDDIIALPEDLKRHEIIDGQIYSSSAPPLVHQHVLGELFMIAYSYIHAHRLGWFYTYRVDVRLSPHDIVVPDLLFIPRELEAIHMYRGDVQGAPPMIAEIIGPDTREVDTGLKFDLYQRSGVSEYWLVDYEARHFQLFVLREGRYQESALEDGRARSEAIPGLVFDPAEAFSDLDDW